MDIVLGLVCISQMSTAKITFSRTISWPCCVISVLGTASSLNKLDTGIGKWGGGGVKICCTLFLVLSTIGNLHHCLSNKVMRVRHIQYV